MDKQTTTLIFLVLWSYKHARICATKLCNLAARHNDLATQPKSHIRYLRSCNESVF